MNAEILAVGTELLMGQIANTNAQYISRKLADLGISVFFHSVVGDNPQRLKDALALALNRSDIVITTGGLGPTQDDLTKETIAQAVNRNLVLHEESLEKLKAFFQRLHVDMVETNEKQAYLPEKSIIIPNNKGTAPGCIIDEQNKTIIMLPGPPNEMQPMFDETVFPYLKKKTNTVIASKMLQVFGIGESLLEKELMDIVQSQSNPTIAPYVKQGEVTLRVTASAKTEAEAQELIKPVVEKISERLGLMLYSTEGKSLAQTVADILKEKRKTIATAESCTGGKIASMLTDVEGISSVFERGYVTYSNESKIQELGVKAETINAFGAVSENTAKEMSEGARRNAMTDIAVSVTGIAGPGGDTSQKPVGLVYISVAGENYLECKEFNLIGDRARIRHVACLNALDMVRKYLLQSE